MKCGVCGGAELVYGKQFVCHTFNDDTTGIEVTGWRCPACDEVILDKANGDLYFASLVEQKARVNTALRETPQSG